MTTPDQPPAAAARAIRDGLADLSGGGIRFSEYHRDGAVPDPIALFTIDTHSLHDTPDLHAFVQVGWRSILPDPLGGARYADAASAGDGFRFSRLVSSARADAMAAAGERMRAIAGDDAHSLRVIESSGLKVAALWLDAPEPVFLPFAGLTAEPIGKAEFLSALAQLHERQRIVAEPNVLPLAAARRTWAIDTGSLPIAAFTRFEGSSALSGILDNIITTLRRRLQALWRRSHASSDHDDEGPTIGAG